jgi:hypothetical protein
MHFILCHHNIKQFPVNISTTPYKLSEFYNFIKSTAKKPNFKAWIKRYKYITVSLVINRLTVRARGYVVEQDRCQTKDKKTITYHTVRKMIKEKTDTKKIPETVLVSRLRE